MRELVIEKYKEILDNMNEYYKDYGHTQWNDQTKKNNFVPTLRHLIKPHPDFDKMSDKELFKNFLKEYKNAGVPRG